MPLTIAIVYRSKNQEGLESNLTCMEVGSYSTLDRRNTSSAKGKLQHFPKDGDWWRARGRIFITVVMSATPMHQKGNYKILRNGLRFIRLDHQANSSFLDKILSRNNHFKRKPYLLICTLHNLHFASWKGSVLVSGNKTHTKSWNGGKDQSIFELSWLEIVIIIANCHKSSCSWKWHIIKVQVASILRF